MARIQLNMSRGELTPYLHARVDLDHYQAGLAYARNWVVLRYGGIVRCPGTIYYGAAKHADKATRGLPFLFNRSQTYRIEAGNLYFRFWSILGRVETSPGVAYEVTTEYLEADLKYLQVRQFGDLVYITCPGYWPQVLTRISETNWTLADYAPEDGPYLDTNATAVTITPSATSGSMNLTLSSVSAVNGGAGWATADVGRRVRFLASNGTWYWFIITARTSSTVAVATLQSGTLPNTTASANWRLSAWSEYDGYPSAIGAYEDRLVFAATERQPTTAWGSVNGDYDDHSISSPLVADDAFTARMSGGQLNSVQWIADGQDILLGTEGSLRVLSRNDSAEAFGPTNLRQKPQTEVPTSYIPGFFVDSALIFLDVYRSILYEALYTNEAGAWTARELSALNEHLVGYGITSIAFQKSPHKIIWMTTDDGLLLAATYDRDQQVFGVTQCDLGNDSTGTAFAEDVMTLPGTTKDGDQVWLAVRRTINNVAVRYVEVLSSFWRYGYSEQELPIYAHCAGYYNSTAVSEINDLDYIEGETVGVWADGVDRGDVTIQSGTLTLPLNLTATQIVWGFRYSSLARTLRLADVGDGQPGLGKNMNNSEIRIDFYQTPVLRAGAGERTVDDYDAGLDLMRPDDTSEMDPYALTTLRTGSQLVRLDDSWENAGVITLETNSMHPATIRALTLFPEGED